ncbi:MAG: glycosyltransferase family 9 protein, partial [Candidatus Omnitrophica bacterium]|nr:glycosyltransferase family 9 protein [Candidatus Omnitrophota bacterium]
MDPKRILITRTDRLGDVVLSTPIIRYIRKSYPDAYIAFMVKPENRDIVANNPHLDEVIVYDKRGEQKSFLSTVKFAQKLKQKKFDTAIALHPTNRVHIMLFLARIPVRIGYDRKMGHLLTKKIPHNKQKGLKHEVDYSFDLLKNAGFYVKGAGRKPYMTTSEEDKHLVDAVFKDSDLRDNIIAIHVGASCSSKRWFPERFAKVADILHEKFNSNIVFVGGDETSEYTKKAVSSMKYNAVDLT